MNNLYNEILCIFVKSVFNVFNFPASKHKTAVLIYLYRIWSADLIGIYFLWLNRYYYLISKLEVKPKGEKKSFC